LDVGTVAASTPAKSFQAAIWFERPGSSAMMILRACAAGLLLAQRCDEP